MSESKFGEDIFACPNNSAVSCHPSARNCAACGWNPDVAKARLEKICRKLGIQVPEIKKPVQEEEE